MNLQYVIENTVYQIDVTDLSVIRINEIIWMILHDLGGQSIKLFKEKGGKK